MEESAKRELALVVACSVVCSIALVVLHSRVPYLPTHDGPQHLLSEYLHNHINDPTQHYARHFEQNEPLTNLAFHWVFSPLEPRLGWRETQRVALVLLGLLWGWGTLALCVSVRRERAVMGLLGFLFATQWSMYMGFFSFTLTAGLSLFALALAVRVTPWTPLRRGAIAGAWFVVALGHVFVAEVLGIALLSLGVWNASGLRARVREALLVCVMGVPAAMVALLSMVTVGELASLDGSTQDIEWLSLWERARSFSSCFITGPWWRAVPVLSVAFGTLVFQLLRWTRGELSQTDRALASTGLAFTTLAFATPLHAMNWDFLSPRFLPFAVVPLLALVPLEQLTPRARTGVLVTVVLFIFAGYHWADRLHHERFAYIADAWEALRAPIRRTGWRMPIVADVGSEQDFQMRTTEVPHWSSTYNLPALFAIEQGGMLVETFASAPTLHAVLHRADGPRRPPHPSRGLSIGLGIATQAPRAFVQQATTLAQFGTSYTDVVMFAPQRTQQALLARGYHADYQRGRVLLARFEGCPVRVQVTGTTEPATLEWGWIPLDEPADTVSIENASTAEIPLRTPCGPVWIRVRGSRAYTCDGARGAGGFLLSATTRTIVCHL